MLQETLNAPHGGTLINLLVSPSRATELQEESRHWPSWDLTPRQLCDLELLLNGAFSPLTGFMTKRDYDSVCESMRLADGTLWPIPITLDLPQAIAESLSVGDHLALQGGRGRGNEWFAAHRVGVVFERMLLHPPGIAGGTRR